MRCGELLELAKARGAFPKKSLGQNFLVDDRIADKIVSLLGSDLGYVLEVGGGHGALSLRLAEVSRELVIVEKDKVLSEHLKDLLSGYSNVKVVEGDILDFQLGSFFPFAFFIFSNLPYNISSPFMFKLWDEADNVSAFVLMFQKEVADRLVASCGTKAYGILSVLFSLCFEVKVVFKVPRHCFWPRPEVDSAVVLGRRTKNLDVEIKGILRKVLDAAFPYRRKKLVKALNLGWSGIDWQLVIKEAGVDGNLRPDAVVPEQWLAIAYACRNLLNKTKA